jgi:hypothetical protein
LLTPLLAQSFSWKSDRTRNEKERRGFSGGGAVEGRREGGSEEGEGGF